MIALFLFTVVQAQELTGNPERAPDLWSKYAWDIAALTGMLLLVCVLVVVVLRVVLPRVLAYGPLHQKNFFRVIARFPLEPKKFLYVVKVGAGHQLIATTEHQVTFLTTLTEADVAMLLEQDATRAPSSQAFEKFSQLLSGKKNEDPTKV